MEESKIEEIVNLTVSKIKLAGFLQKCVEYAEALRMACKPF